MTFEKIYTLKKHFNMFKIKLPYLLPVKHFNASGWMLCISLKVSISIFETANSLISSSFTRFTGKIIKKFSLIFTIKMIVFHVDAYS